MGLQFLNSKSSFPAFVLFLSILKNYVYVMHCLFFVCFWHQSLMWGDAELSSVQLHKQPISNQTCQINPNRSNLWLSQSFCLHSPSQRISFQKVITQKLPPLLFFLLSFYLEYVFVLQSYLLLRPCQRVSRRSFTWNRTAKNTQEWLHFYSS